MADATDVFLASLHKQHYRGDILWGKSDEANTERAWEPGKPLTERQRQLLQEATDGLMYKDAKGEWQLTP